MWFSEAELGAWVREEPDEAADVQLADQQLNATASGKVLHQSQSQQQRRQQQPDQGKEYAVEGQEAAARVTKDAAISVFSGVGDEELPDDDEDAEAAAQKQREAEAAAAAAATAAAAAAAEEAAAELAARLARPPRPFAPGVKPRLFVVFGGTGEGYELLDTDQLMAYERAAAAVPGSRHDVLPVHGAPEPGSSSHAFICCHPQQAAELQPLPLADVSRPIPVLGGGGLPALKHPSTVHVSRDAGGCPDAGKAAGAGGGYAPALGLRLPQATAIVPVAVAAAGSAGRGTLMVDRVVAGGMGVSAGGGAGSPPVVVVREVTQLPMMTADMAAAVEAALTRHAAAAVEREALALALARAVPEVLLSDEQQQEASEVGVELAEVAEQLLTQRAAIGKEQVCEEAVAAAVRDERMRAEEERRKVEEAAEAAAAEAAANRKVKRCAGC